MIEKEKSQPLKLKFNSYIDKKEDFNIKEKFNNNINTIFILISTMFFFNFITDSNSIFLKNLKTPNQIINNSNQANNYPKDKIVPLSEIEKLEKTNQQTQYVEINPGFIFSSHYIDHLEASEDQFTPEAFDKFKKIITQTNYYKDMMKDGLYTENIRAANSTHIKTVTINNKEYHTYYVPIVITTDKKIYNFNEIITFSKQETKNGEFIKFIKSDISIKETVINK